jgi:hypothetical protein
MPAKPRVPVWKALDFAGRSRKRRAIVQFIVFAVILLICVVVGIRYVPQISFAINILQVVFNLIPDLAGYFLAMAGVALLFLTKELEQLERYRKLRFGLATFIFVVGLGAVVSNSSQKSADKESAEKERAELTAQISMLIASAQIQATGADLKKLGDRLVSAIQKQPKPTSGPLSKPAPPEEKPTPAPPTIENTTLVQRAAPSGDPKLPYGLQVIIQSNVVLDNVNFALECDGEIGNVEFFVAGQGIYMSKRIGIGGPNNNTATVAFAFPPLRPETPLVITLLSKAQIRVVKAYKLHL